jgi:sugar transferase (PEP-CTERM system associated)
MVLAGVEIIIVYASLHLALLFKAEGSPAGVALHTAALGATALVLTGMLVAGLYGRDQWEAVNAHWFHEALRIGLGLFLSAAILIVYGAFALESLLDSPTVALGMGFAFVALFTERRLYRHLRISQALERRMIVLGAGTRAQAVEKTHAVSSARAPFKVLAYVVPHADNSSFDVPEDRVLRMQPQQRLLDLVLELRADEIVVAIRDRRGTLPIRQLLECKLQGITVTEASAFFEREHHHLQLDSLNASWLIFGTGFRQTWFGRLAKRGFDLAVSTVLLVLTLPIMLLTAAAIRLDSSGPVLYWQTRVGRGNANFEMCKFRSMREDAERDGVAKWAAGDDDRVTRVGRVIRKLRIDELPQIINVLRGEMSFVGPRPERPFFVNQLSEQIPYFLARHSIRPGITGWAQVRYPYGASVEDARQKLQYDLYYVKNHTLFLDILILLETVKVVVFGRGAR